MNTKKPLLLSILSLSVMALSGCLGTQALSGGITAEGTVETTDLVFPQVESAWQKEGSYPNVESVKTMTAGVNKDTIYQLLGRPHFNEGHNAREWDYILNFKLPSGDTKVCQYKVIFDKNYQGQQFFWKDSSCQDYVNSFGGSNTPAAPQVMVSAPQTQRVNLSADALFGFDKHSYLDILPAGKAELDIVADTLLEAQSKGDVRVIVTGHTDHKGSDSYNMGLSQLRANTIRTYFINKGVEPSSIIATGAGESQPIKQCSTSLPRQSEIDCLQPNRRVVVDIAQYIHSN